jgi:predicted metal-binding membrane protein
MATQTSHTAPDRSDPSMLGRGWPPRLPRSPLARGQITILLTLIILTVAAWALTIRQAQTMTMPMGVSAGAPMPAAGSSSGMDGMSMDQVGEVAASGMGGAAWSVSGLVAFTVAWAVMMAAMMFPAAAPMLLLFHTVASNRKTSGGAFVPTWVFAAGYLLVWTAVGAVTWALIQIASERATALGDAERARWAPLALGSVLIVAGLYQLTPLKQVCLDHCRSPFAFVMQHWREGYGGALRMGIVHGAYCLGCCWALFAVLVATGVMSLAWMLLLTLIVFMEKVLPAGRRAARGIGVAFVLLGLLVASGVMALPWMA